MPLGLALLALSLQAKADIQIPFRETDEGIFVDVSVNDHPLTLLFDSGFSAAVIVDSEVNIGPSTGKTTLVDFVGTVEVDTVKLKSLKVGGISLDTGTTPVMKQAMGTTGYGLHSDGLLGLHAFQNFVTEINFEKKMFVLHPKNFLENKKPDGVKTFLTKMLPIGSNSIVLEVKTHRDKSFVMSLDTGNSFYATTHKDVLQRVGLWGEDQEAKYAKESFVASGAVKSWSALMTNLTIFGVPVKESVWDVIDRPAGTAESDGTVGFQFLKNFNLVFDLDRRQVWFENWTGKVAPDDFGETGITAYRDPREQKIVIVAVAPESPADKAGIKEGDELLSIGDVDLTNQGFRKLRKMLSGPVGSKIRIAFSHLGGVKSVNLELQSLANPTKD